jgi:branched-subunit amino acid ABC-type transport system permease component
VRARRRGDRALRPAARASQRPRREILFTFGLAYIIEELVTMVWGRNAVASPVPAAIDFALFSVFDSTFPAYKGLMMAISVAMFVFLYVALRRTRIGLIIQAALTHPKMGRRRSATTCPACTCSCSRWAAAWRGSRA